MVGIGRLLTILIAGVISDRIGRQKPFLISIISDTLFLLGISFAPNIVVASIAALFLAITNSFGDSAVYPAMIEAFPKKATTINSLLKAAMSVAQFLFPFWVAAVANAPLTAVVLAIDGVLLIMLGFTICFTFYVFSQYIPQFALIVVGSS
ncbi:MFS transporter [Bombilactobacillus apium]|uniref:hypothetical protein n=1 Tax=Bombilactobacillus apium TaxID=2675299 RepID=UPI001E433B2F|nr:hypothetical protein [Bombilactobacillus apium]